MIPINVKGIPGMDVKMQKIFFWRRLCDLRPEVSLRSVCRTKRKANLAHISHAEKFNDIRAQIVLSRNE